MKVLYFTLLLAIISFTSADWFQTLPDCVDKCPKSYSLKERTACVKRCYDFRFNRDDDDETVKAQVNSEAAWVKYREAMITAFTRQSDVSKSRIQVLNIPFDATWDSNPEQLTRLADAVPYASGFYEPSGYTVREQYRDFINNINRATDGQIASPSDKAELDKWSAIYADLSNKLFPAQIECAQNFKASNTKLSFQEFEKTCANFQSLKKKIDEANTYIEWHSSFAYGLDYASLVQSRMHAKTLPSMQFKEIGGGLADFVASYKKGATNSLSFEFSLQTGARANDSYDKFTKGMKRPSSLTGSMFSLMAGPKADGISTTTDKFRMKFSFASWKRIRISPGDWFSADVISKFKSGPFIYQQRHLFGSNGSMSLLPTAVYVAIRPTVEMVVNKKDQFNLDKSIREGSSGLFSSKSVTAEISTKYVSEDAYHVTIKSNSNVPQVIALDFDQL